MKISSIIDNIPDKTQDKNTTSLEFKKDLIEYLGDDYKDKICLEVGTSKGYSTRILSFLFKKVITVENNSELVEFAKKFNEDIDNIDYYLGDVYQSEWEFDEDIQVVFIDCVHEYNFIRNDIINAINYFDKPLLFFDDYGLFPNSVMKCIDEFTEQGVLKVIKKI